MTRPRRSTVLVAITVLVAVATVPAIANAKSKPCPGDDPEIDVVYIELTKVEGMTLTARVKDPRTGAVSGEVEIRKGERGWVLDLSQWKVRIPFPVTRETLREGLIAERPEFVFSYWTPRDGVFTELEPAPGGGVRCAARIPLDAFRRWTLKVAATPANFHIPAFCDQSCSGKETEITATVDEHSRLRIIMNKGTVCSFPVDVDPRDAFPKTISHRTIITSLAATCTDWRTMEFVAARLIPQEIVVTETGK